MNQINQVYGNAIAYSIHWSTIEVVVTKGILWLLRIKSHMANSMSKQNWDFFTKSLNYKICTNHNFSSLWTYAFNVRLSVYKHVHSKIFS